MNRLHAFLSLTALSLATVAQAQTVQFATAGPAQTVRNWTPSLPGAGYLVNNYQYDDGISENAIGVTTTGTPSLGLVCWLTRYDAVGGADTITQVSVAYGSLLTPGGAPANGSPATVCVWEDPNDDGNPIDAVLLTQQATTVANGDTDILNPVAITPVNVSGVFFVGAFCPSQWSTPALSDFPAAIDTTSQSLGRSWIIGHSPSTGFNPVNLAGPYSINLLETSTIGAAFDGVWLLRAEGNSTAPTIYCTAKLTSNGCTPSIGSTGISSVGSGSGFVINGTTFINNKNCLLFYGSTGQAALPFQGGTLCVKTPIKRTGSTNTFGNPPPNDCSGAPTIDMNTFASTQPAGSALLTVGTTINCQWWGRDPGFVAPNNTQLSDALEYVVGP